MNNKLTQYYTLEKKRVIERCKECGVCAKKCPIICHTELNTVSPQDIQIRIKAYLQDGTPNKTVFTRALSCMECFKCADKCCPEGLNPMLVNEIIKWEYRNNNIVETPYGDPQAADSAHRAIAGIQINRDAYHKISTPSQKDGARYVLFAGCNVYLQPEKILTCLDIVDLITEDYAFVPGLDFCCGDVHIFYGSIAKAETSSQQLVEKIASYNPKEVIFWCPTCLCRLEKTISQTAKIPFPMMSFPQFLAKHMDKLTFKKQIRKTVTLHEACKAAFTGVDLTGARTVLQNIPGVKLVEMPRHGKNTVCCGSGAADYFQNSFEAVRDDRMMEAARTNADVFANVCHHCHTVFVGNEDKYNYSVKNYVNLVAEALGIKREDIFKKYRQMKNIDTILEDIDKRVDESPFTREQITEALNTIFIRHRSKKGEVNGAEPEKRNISR
ncbi:MAG: (Fe-S)-binding protein [Desulfobacterales bacterium]|jgi:Fe-S oxidoreductase